MIHVCKQQNPSTSVCNPQKRFFCNDFTSVIQVCKQQNPSTSVCNPLKRFFVCKIKLAEEDLFLSSKSVCFRRLVNSGTFSVQKKIAYKIQKVNKKGRNILSKNGYAQITYAFILLVVCILLKVFVFVFVKQIN